MGYDLSGRALYTLGDLLTREEFPLADLIPEDALAAVFDGLWYTDAESYVSDEGLQINLRLAFEGELALSPPGLPGVSLVAASGGPGWTSLPVEFVLGPGAYAALRDVPIAIRVDRAFLQPMTSRTEVDVEKPGVEIPLGFASLAIGPEGVSFESEIAIDLPLCMIGESGTLVEAQQISLHLDDAHPPPGQQAGWRGVHIARANLYLPGDLGEALGSLSLVDASIGSGGFTGAVASDWDPPQQVTLGGFRFELRRVRIGFVQNALVAGEILGRITLPFFDAPLDVTIGINLGGGFTVALSSPNGLITLHKDDLFDLTLESVGFAVEGGVFTVALSGQLTPLVRTPQLEWPTFRVQQLAIDSQGRVRVEGGWLDLPEQYVLSLYGFQIEISKLGFGTTEDGRRWLGFSGGLKLVEGLTAGASVEGLRVIWNPSDNPPRPAFTLNGVGVAFEVPNVVSFTGQIAMTEPAVGVVRFDGDITLKLMTLGLEVEAQLVIGYDSVGDYTFFAIYLGVELPAGIPLWSTGLGLYGMAGLFALNMEPGRYDDPADAAHPVEAWYAIQPAPSWFHRDEDGVTDLGKWRNKQGSLALGAGVTIGTVVDNGFAFSGKFLLGIVLPGPILFIEGCANILKERSKLGDDPVFRALAVLDTRPGPDGRPAGTFLVGLDAQYKLADGGELIEIGGGAEVFFNFNNPGAWHLYLGIDEPRERRIRASIFFHIFEANAYFMLDADRLRLGAWIGYDNEWEFGPLRVVLQAWIEGSAELTRKPAYFQGSLWLHGKVEALVFGFGFGLEADARVEAGVFDPFRVRAEVGVKVNLPWPLPDFNVNVEMEWKDDPIPPALPLPLQEVAIEHLKVSTSWPLPAGSLLLDPMDIDAQGRLERDGFFRNQPPASRSETAPPPLAGVPVVPLDARPHITFGRSVRDTALVGINPDPSEGWEMIGDPNPDNNSGPARVRLSVTAVSVDRWQDPIWQTLACKPARPAEPSIPELYASWAPTPQSSAGSEPPPLAKTKLWLWSLSPFDYTRRTGGRWEEWFRELYPNYPCIDIPADEEICCDFASLTPPTAPAPPWICPKHPQIQVTWRVVPAPLVIDEPRTQTRALCFPAGSQATVLLGREVKRVRVFVAGGRGSEEEECINFSTRQPGVGPNPLRERGVLFEVIGPNGVRPPQTRIIAFNTSTGPLAGLDISRELVVRLPAPSDFVEMLVTSRADPIQVAAFDAGGRTLASARQTSPAGQSQSLRLTAPAGSTGITLVRLRAPQNEAALHEFCRGRRLPGAITGTALDRTGAVVGTFAESGGIIDVPGRTVTRVVVASSQGEFYLTQVCIIVGIDAAERIVREEMQSHIIDHVAEWENDGVVLPPWSTFRVAITTTLEVQALPPLDDSFRGTRTMTQYGYFRTQGPPGLARLELPSGHPLQAAAPVGGTDAPAFDSGLDDLSRYVAQTIPPTVPAPGEKPILPRPVYRGYDVGVLFNETYVDQMYAAAGRDLSLYLFDTNDQPARDERGRLLNPPNRWSRQDTLTLTESEEHWLALIDAATCVEIDRNDIARDKAIVGDGHVLAAETVYEARLTPLLLRDTFTGYAVDVPTRGPAGRLVGGVAGGWTVQDDGSAEGPSRWVVREDGSPPARWLEQTSNVSRGASQRAADYPGGTMCLPADNPNLLASHADQPGQWTDCRASAYVRSTDDDLVGLAVRVTGRSGYLFYLDRELNRRRLVRLDDGSATILAESPGSYLPGIDTQIAFEAVEDRLRVFADGLLVFTWTDATYSSGRIALYCGQNAGGRFADVRVDDLRRTAPTVYRFQFTTSRFTDFRHHLHSYRGLTFVTALADLTSVATALAAAVNLGDPAVAELPTENEARAYSVLAAEALGATAPQLIATVDVTRIEQGGNAIGLLVRTAEPIDWRRTSLVVERAAPQSLSPTPPTGPRLIEATFTAGTTPAANDESVSVLLGEDADLTGWRIEWRAPGAAAWEVWYLFESESLRMAGRRYRVFAGRATDPAPPSSGEEPRFRNVAPTFPAQGVDLRLVAPAGSVAHERRFLPRSSYSPVAGRMLRAADGTGLIVLGPPANAPGSLLARGEYRLRFTFRRDDSPRLVLSQNGDRSAETVEMDIPWSVSG